MLSVINEQVLATARRLNERDAKIASGNLTAENAPSDNDFWAEPNSGADGLRGKEGQRKVAGGSYYSYGPYPRNRRILADIALCTGWDVAKTQELEQFCVSYAATGYEQADKEYRDHRDAQSPWDLSDLKNPKKGKQPFTFQHIAWDRLQHMIKRQVQEMDPGKLAAVKAGVFDMYESNSKTGKKKLPRVEAGKKRKSMNKPGEEEVERAQEEIDKEERYRNAIRCSIRRGYKEPALVKTQVEAYMASHDMSEECLCKTIGVSLEEWKDFSDMRKKKDMYSTKAYHAAKKFLGCPELGELLDKENMSPPPYVQDAEMVRKKLKRR